MRVCLSCFHDYPRRSAETTKTIVYCLFSLPSFPVPPGLVCMKSSSSVVELVMLLCSQASLASLSFLILVLHSPPTSLLTLSAVNPHSGHAESYLSSTLPRPPSPHSSHPRVRAQETGEKASMAANIGRRVKGGRPVRVTSDPSTGPRGLGQTDEEG